MEENKYYTPEIEEFHVGFEYEWRFKPDPDRITPNYDDDFVSALDLIHHGGKPPRDVWEKNIADNEKHYQEKITWKKAIINDDTLEIYLDGGTNPENPFHSWRDVEFRVKYLDREDIEAEGFNFLYEDQGRLIFRSINKVGRIPKHTDLLFNPTNNWVLTWGACNFTGTIKNISEFRKILKIITA